MTDLIFIFGAKYLFVLSIIVIGWHLYILPSEWRWTIIRFLSISLPLTWFLGEATGELVYNTRPFVEGGFKPLVEHVANNGFPSGHMLLASGLAAPFIFFNKQLSDWLWIIAIAVGISRVYVGVHHIEDIIASAFIALLAAYIVEVVLKRQSSKIVNHAK